MHRIAIAAVLCHMMACAGNATMRPSSASQPSAEPVDASLPAGVPAEVAEPSETERVATCLARAGVTLFGNCYVPAHHAQLRLFGDEIARIDLVMCLTCMDVYGANERCHAAKVQDYPTWLFPDGRVLVGVQSLSALWAAADCGSDH